MTRRTGEVHVEASLPRTDSEIKATIRLVRRASTSLRNGQPSHVVPDGSRLP